MVERYLVRGGNRLAGKIRVSGSKNAVLPMLAATLLTANHCRIIDAPMLRDVTVMLDLLRQLGAEVSVTAIDGRTCLDVCASNLVAHEVPERLMRQMRSSIFLMGPLLGRLGQVRISHPGGCAIGPRPIDYHLRGLEALGAEICDRHGFIEAVATRLVGADVHLDFPSVGATENLMMAAARARGTTVIRNAAKEPEIVDLQNFLNVLGCRIRGAGTDVIRIEGVSDLREAEHTVIPDRIEAGTFMAMAAATRGHLTLTNVIPDHLDAPIAKLREAGVEVSERFGSIVVRCSGRIRGIDCKTLPYPGFPTDLQPQMMALLTIAEGTSIVTETVFENRFTHAEELSRMGAGIKMESRTAVIKGVDQLFGAVVEASDLRSGAALVLAGLVARGVTTVDHITHIERGYEGLETKLQAVGADIMRIREQPDEARAVGG